MSQLFQDFVDLLTQSQCTENLIDAMSKSVASVGLERFAYVNYCRVGSQDENPLILTTYPKLWLQRYVEKDYAGIDPILAKSSDSAAPFAWNTKIHSNLTLSQKIFYDEAQEFEIQKGLTVPISGNLGRVAVLTLIGAHKDQHFDLLIKERGATFHLLALYFHASFLANHDTVPRSSSPLTSREKDCLLWSARGKTKWEVAVILGISKSTVSFHLQNAQRKYGVFSTVAAVAKAVKAADIIL